MKMKVITLEEHIADVPNRWFGTYGDNDQCKSLHALKELTVESIAEIIGNYSWTRLHCHFCDSSVDKIVRVQHKTNICKSCIKQMKDTYDNNR